MAIVTCRSPREIARDKERLARSQAYVDSRKNAEGMTDKELQMTAVWRLKLEQLLGKGK